MIRDARHIGSLDGFRGVAVLLVAVYHLFPHRGAGPLGHLASGGWIGVDLFFALSGFLITGILHDHGGGAGFFKSFYARRALRLFPLYFLFVAVTVVLNGRGDDSWWMVLSYLFYASNIIRVAYPGFVIEGPVETAHLWSLAVEEQFYLIWPVIVVALGSRRRVLAACLAGSGAALLMRLVVSHAPLPAVSCYLLLPTRADGLLLGGAAAMLVRGPALDLPRWATPVRAVTLGAWGAFMALSVSIWSFHFGAEPVRTWGLACTAIGSASLLLWALVEGSWIQRVCSWGPLRTLGKYSYGFYLLHFMFASHVRAFKAAIMDAIGIHWLSSIIGGVLVFLATMAVEWVLFRVLEAPFLRLKYRFPYPSRTST